MAGMGSASLSPDDALIQRLQAPPDLREGSEALAYWRARRRGLPWYRLGARREAARMAAAWEKRVRAALLWQRGLPTEARVQAVRLIAGFWLRRSAARVVRKLAVTGAVVLLLLGCAAFALGSLLHAL